MIRLCTWVLTGNCCSVPKSLPTLCDPMDCNLPGFPPFTISQSLHKLTSTEQVLPSNHLILCRPLLFLPSIFPSITVFSNESALHIRWLKYWCFSFTISPSNGHPGLIFFRRDWLDLFAVQGTLKSFLQHQVQKHQFSSAQRFLTVQLSHPYKNTGKTIALKIDVCWHGNISTFQYTI